MSNCAFAAFNTFAVSAQNMVYADRAGNIGQLMAAMLPVRARPLPPDLQECGVGVIVRGRELETDDVLERGELRLHPTQGLDDGVGGADGDLRAAVLENELPLLRELRLVHGHVGGAQPVRGVARDGPLDPVVRDDRDDVAAADAQAREAAAERVHQVAELGVRDPRPGRALLHPEQVLTGELATAPLAQLDEILELHRHGVRPPCPAGVGETAPCRVGGGAQRGLHGLPRPVRLGPGMAEETTHRLADGTKIRTRPLRPDDREKLRNGFARMSPESKYRRFFAAPATLSERTLDYLTRTDGWNHVAIGAELADEGADPSYGIGIARFVRLADHPGTAEAAVAVIDEMQRRGVGRLLLGELIKAAREREITTFVCYVLPSNEPVKSLLHTLDAEAKPRLENGVLTYELTLPEAAPHERDPAPMYRLFRLAAEGLRVIFRRVPGSEPDEPGE